MAEPRVQSHREDADRDQVHDAASHGVAGGAGPLPFLDQIQRAFGRHDITGIQAHTDAAAASAASEIGATAYATGHHVAFAGSPDLHTAAHEAAHVVQQRAGVHLHGGVGADGDAYESHADEVADLVVQGRSAESVLDRHASASASASTTAVQRKLGGDVKKDTPVVRHTDDGDEDHYVVEQPGSRHQIRNTQTNEVFEVTRFDPAWGTSDNRVESRRSWLRVRDEDDLKLGTNYVSEDYKRINSLLGALETLGFTPEQIMDPKLDISKREPEVVAAYRKTAIDRRCLRPNDAETWDIAHVRDTLALFHRLHRVWNKFGRKAIPDGVVRRGDTAAIYQSFAYLDPAANNYTDGRHAIHQTIRWPGVMSTTVGAAKECNLTADRKILWIFNVPAEHQGKILGDNASENEATFPLGTSVQVDEVLVRRTNKDEGADQYGVAEVVVFARITSVAPPESDANDTPASSDHPSGQPPPSAPPEPSNSNGMASETERAPKKLSVAEQMHLAILRRGLKAAETERDTETATDLRDQIAILEGAPPKILSPAELIQLGILQRGLDTAEASGATEDALDLRDRIAALQGTHREPRTKAADHGGTDHGQVLMVDTDVTGAEDNERYRVDRIIPGGAHGAWKITRTSDGASFLWKPSAAASVRDGRASAEMMADAETGATGLASLVVGGYLVPRAERLTFNGHLGTRQPFIDVKKEDFNPKNLEGKRAAQMVAHMIADWIISNHDNNDSQFLFDTGDNLIGIDKGQAYKHFKEGDIESSVVTKAKAQLEAMGPKTEANELAWDKVASDIEPDHLVPDYHPSGNFKVPSPGPFVEHVMKLERLPFTWQDEAVQTAIRNAEALTIADVEHFLAPYAQRVFPGREAELYQAVVNRAHRIQKDLALIFKDRYEPAESAPGHRDYTPALPPPKASATRAPRPYRGPELAELGKDASGTTHTPVALTEGGQRDIETLLADFAKFDHRGAKQHDGTLRQHSIYVANAVDYMFEAAEHPDTFKGRQPGDEAAMYGDYVKNVPPELRPLLALTGFLHDAGKAGEAHLDEDDLVIGGKHQHPREGFEMMLPSDKRAPVSTVSDANNKRTDFDYHLRAEHDHGASKSTFDFGAFFDAMKLDPKQRAIVQICTAMHYEFGGTVLKALGDAPDAAQLKNVFDRFLGKLRTITERAAYGPVDELLVNLVVLIGAADVLGAKEIIVAAEQQSIYAFPAEPSKRASGSDSFSEYGFKDRGRLVRLALLHYFRTGEVQAFDFQEPARDALLRQIDRLPTLQVHPDLIERVLAEELPASQHLSRYQTLCADRNTTSQ